MGELALARDRDSIALEEYMAAAFEREDPAVARRATLIALLAGDPMAAGRAADRWEALSPGDLEAAKYQAILHGRAGETAVALQYLLRIADGGTGVATGMNLRAITTMLAAEPNPWRSADLMAAVAQARPAHPEGWWGAALLALAADRPVRAKQFADLALLRDPNLLDAMFLRAEAELLARPLEAGREVLAPLEGFRNSRDSGKRYRFASLLVLAGRTAEADALFEDILVNAPDQHDARMARALLAMETGRDEVAAAELQRLLQRHGRMQDALYFLGVLAEKRGKLQDAMDWYAQVSPEVDRWADAQIGVGRVLLQQEGPDGLHRFLEKLRDHWPELETFLTLNEAALLTANGFASRSLPLLDAIGPLTAVERLEYDWQVALAAARAGNVARAETTFRRLLARDPGNPSVQNALGFLLLEQTDRWGDAEKLLESALKSAPANAAILDSVGWLRFRQGKPAAARSLLEESWQRRQSRTTAKHLLTVLHALGDEQSMLDLRDAIEARFPGLETEDSI